MFYSLTLDDSEMFDSGNRGFPANGRRSRNPGSDLLVTLGESLGHHERIFDSSMFDTNGGRCIMQTRLLRRESRAGIPASIERAIFKARIPPRERSAGGGNIV